MKKLAVIALSFLALLLVAGLIAGALFWKRLAPPAVRPEAILPADTLFLAEMVDLTRTGLRWRDTELYKLWAEPEMQAFFEKPLATHPDLKNLKQLTDEMILLWPRQAFVAVTGMNGNTPRVIGGFSFQGDGRIADRWLAEPRRSLKSEHPAGKAELIQHGKTEIQTYTDEGFVLAEASHGGWRFVANDLETLKTTLDRLDQVAKPTGPLLAGDADYRHALAPLPTDSELRVFVRTGMFVDRLLTAMGDASSSMQETLKGLRQVRALAGTSRLEGGQVRDSVFTLMLPAEANTPTPTATPLARQALDLTTPDTAVFYSLRLNEAGFAGLPPEAMQMIPLFSGFWKALEAQGSKVSELPAIFGPEMALVLQKPQGLQLSGVLAVSLRDGARAAKLAEGLTSPDLGPMAWTVDDALGKRLFASPALSGLLPVSATLGITDRYWLLGLTAPSVLSFLERAPGGSHLDSVSSFSEQASRLVSPTEAFGYVDVGGLFENSYNSVRPMAALALVGSPELGQYLDAGKLPSAAVVGRHLGQLVISHGVAPEGTLWESRGNVSLGQLSLAAVAAAVANRESLGGMMGPLGLPGGQLPGSTIPPPPDFRPDDPVVPAPAPEAEQTVEGSGADAKTQ